MGGFICAKGSRICGADGYYPQLGFTHCKSERVYILINQLTSTNIWKRSEVLLWIIKKQKWLHMCFLRFYFTLKIDLFDRWTEGGRGKERLSSAGWFPKQIQWMGLGQDEAGGPVLGEPSAVFSGALAKSWIRSRVNWALNQCSNMGTASCSIMCCTMLAPLPRF